MEQFSKISLEKGLAYSKLSEYGRDPATVAKLGKLISMTEDEFFVEINSNFTAGTCANGVAYCVKGIRVLTDMIGLLVLSKNLAKFKIWHYSLAVLPLKSSLKYFINFYLLFSSYHVLLILLMAHKNAL